MTFTLKLESPHFRSCCFRLCDRCALRSRATPLRDVTVRPSDGVLEERSDHLSPNKPKAQAGKRADSYDKNVHKTEAAAVCTFTFHVIAFSIIIETVLIFNIQPINISTEGIKIINIFFIYFLSSCVLSTITRFFTLSQMYHSVRTGNLCRPGVLHLSGSSPQSVFSNLRSGGRGAAQTGLSRVISNITPPSHPPFICTMWANHLRLCQEANHQESALHRLSISGTGQTLVKGCLLSTEQDASISSHTVPVLFYSQCLEQCGQLTVHLPISSITRRLFLKGAVCTFKEQILRKTYLTYFFKCLKKTKYTNCLCFHDLIKLVNKRTLMVNTSSYHIVLFIFGRHQLLASNYVLGTQLSSENSLFIQLWKR